MNFHSVRNVFNVMDMNDEYSPLCSLSSLSMISYASLAAKEREVRLRVGMGIGTKADEELEQLAPDDAYLSYYDVRLTKEDVNVLKGDWLTDNVIAFWEEYLEREFLTSYKNSKIVLLRPAMSFMLLQTPDPRVIADALPDFRQVTHVFLPINDCNSTTVAEGGTHWSLLLVSIVDGVAFHYDSLPPGNEHEAFQVTRKFSQLLNKMIKFIPLQDSPQQENSSDCGVFVCLNMRHLLLKKLLTARTNEKVSMSLGGRRVDAREGRKEMLRLIDERRREGERRRSASASPHPSRKSRSPPRIDSPIGSQQGSPLRQWEVVSIDDARRSR